MIKALFDPEGRIGPDDFLKSSLILVVIGAIFSLLPLATTSMWLSFVSLVVVYPWAVIWIKRLHDAGKPGWMFLIVFALWVIVILTASHFITAEFAGDMGPTPKDFSAAMAWGMARAQVVAIPNAIASSILALLFALAGNVFLKSDPEPNAYDPDPHMR